MKYNCLVVDDEELARELIESHLSQLRDFSLIASCSSAIEAHKVLQDHKIDLMFLDIEMPMLKGTDFLENLSEKPKVILTTAYREYALQGYELDVVDYLLKPIVFARFFKAIDKFRQQVVIQNSNKGEENEYIYIQKNRKNIKIKLEDILYIESIKDYLKIHFENNSVQFKNSISAFEQKLGRQFIRVHRSFIVNSNKISAFTRQDIEIGGIEIPIGESYKNDVLTRFGLI